MFGQSLPRVEDADLLSGRARFLADLQEAASALTLGVLRSPYAHATVDLSSIGASGEDKLILPEDVDHLRWEQLLDGPPQLQPLAGNRVRYVGQPVLAVLAPDQETAEDDLGSIFPDYEPLPAAVDVASALEPGAPLVYQEMETNVIWHDRSDTESEVFERADVTLERTFVSPRMAPGMMECRGILATPQSDGGVTVHVGHQNPHKLKRELSQIFGLAADQVRVVVPSVGGAFGAKASLYPDYVLAVHAALATGQPVKYIEKRTENLLVTNHGRGQFQRVKIAATGGGQIQGLSVEIDADFGAAADLQRWCIMLTRRLLSGAYRIPHIEWDIRGVLTHTPPIGAFRGAGRPEAAFLVERAVDELARELSIDPVELRLRNFVDAEDFPYETPTGAVYDSGDYSTALRLAVEKSGYRGIRNRQAHQKDSKVLGVGVASYVEVSASGEEFGSVAMDREGSVLVRTGTSPHGQGHDTTWAQLAATELGVSPTEVKVIHGDTDLVPRGGGTSGSRSAALGGSAVHTAADRLAVRLKEMAAKSLEASAHDILLREGRATVVGTDVGVTLSSLVDAAGGEIEQVEIYESMSQNYPFGTHVCVLDVDSQTGEISIHRLVEVDDCGRVINPLIVEGQLHGGALQGVFHALREVVTFSEAGQPVSNNLSTYSLPAISESIDVEAYRTETPSPLNPLGIKGVGESGVTGATPAVVNAIYDALSRLGVDSSSVHMPFTPARVWAAMAAT